MSNGRYNSQTQAMEFSYNNYLCEVNANSTNSEIIYSQVQKIYVKGRNEEERQRELRISIEKGMLGIHRQKTLTLQVTDDEDPFVLYSLVLTEEDFKTLKAQQGLLVDFDNFSAQLKRLLEQCGTHPENLGPKFLLILDESHRESNYISIKVLETNQFKHLCHLDLKMCYASDTDLKNHMSIKIKNFKDTNQRVEIKLREQNIEIADLRQKIHELRQENEQHSKKWLDEKNLLSIQHLKEMTQQKEKNSNMQIEMQYKFEEIQKNSDAIYKKKISDLEDQILKQNNEKQQMLNKISHIESSLNENKKQMELIEKDLTSAHKEIASLKNQNSKLDIDYHEKEKSIASLKARLVTFDQEIKTKVSLLNKQSELLKSVNEQKEIFEEELKKKEEYLQQKLATLEKLSQELFKANDLLHATQTELNSINSKLKLRTCIALEQERLLDVKQNEIQKYIDEISLKDKKISELSNCQQQMKLSLEMTNQQLETQKNELKNNESVITWLNKRLKEEKLKFNPNSDLKKVLASQSTPYESARNIQSYLMTNQRKEMASQSLPTSSRIDSSNLPSDDTRLDLQSLTAIHDSESSAKGVGGFSEKKSSSKASSFFP